MSKNKKKLAIVSSTTKNNFSISSSYLSRLISILCEEYEIDIFSPKVENDFFENTNVSVHHVHKLPILLHREEYFNLIYCIENNLSDYLCYWYLNHYPGIVVLHETNFFKFFVSSLGHGSDSYEINKLIQDEYGDSSIRIGDQYIRSRSLEIYSEFYSFIEKITRNSLCSVFFRDLISEKSSTPYFITDLLIRNDYKKNSLSLRSNNNAEKPINEFLILIESATSRAALEILKKIEIENSVNRFPLILKLERSSELLFNDTSIEHKIEVLDKNFEIDFNNINGLITLGDREFHGLREVTLNAMSSFVPIACEETASIANTIYPYLVLHSFKDSLLEIINKISDFNSNILYKNKNLNYEMNKLMKLSDLIFDYSNDFACQLKTKFQMNKDIVSSHIKRLKENNLVFIDEISLTKGGRFDIEKEYDKSSEIFDI